MPNETFKQEKLTDFTVIRNAIFKDYRLSAKAVGVACKLLSLPPTWDYSVRGIVALFSDGESSIRSALSELEKYGYLRRERVRDQGKLGGCRYIITDTLKLEKPNVENPHVDNPRVDNHAQLNTKELNTKKSNTKKSNTNNLHTHKELRPTLEEIEDYISDKDLNVDAQKFYEYFDAGDWLDSKGKPVRNWKQKLITWSNSNGSNDFGTGSGVRSRIRSTDGRSTGDAEQVETGFIPHA